MTSLFFEKILSFIIHIVILKTCTLFTYMVFSTVVYKQIIIVKAPIFPSKEDSASKET